MKGLGSLRRKVVVRWTMVYCNCESVKRSKCVLGGHHGKS